MDVDTFIVALDAQNKKEAGKLLACFGQTRPFLKIGMSLFYETGAKWIRELKNDGYRIFLDLKLHDIPSVVRRAARTLAALDVDMLTVHASGGGAMLRAARDGVAEGTKAGKRRPLLIAVTQLTSTDETTLKNELLIERRMEDVVTHYAHLAWRCRLDGIVCSAQENAAVRRACGDGMLIVNPGIRAVGDHCHDQRRVVTPALARRLGANYIVVGRSIINAQDVASAYRNMRKEWESGRE